MGFSAKGIVFTSRGLLFNNAANGMNTLWSLRVTTTI